MAQQKIGASKIAIILALLLMVGMGFVGILLALFVNQILGIAVIFLGVLLGVLGIIAGLVLEKLGKKQG